MRVPFDSPVEVTVSFVLDGQQFTALNGGPNFQFTLAISFVVNCQTQADVDQLWASHETLDLSALQEAHDHA